MARQIRSRWISSFGGNEKAIVDVGDRKIGAKMPGRFQEMRPVAFGNVAYQPESAVEMKDTPAMPHWMGESLISGMRAREKGEIRSGNPALSLRDGKGTPRKGTFGLSLIESID